MGDVHNSVEGSGRAAVLVRNWWVIGLRGCCTVLFGLVALLRPELTIETMEVLFGIYMLVDGVWTITSGVRAAARHDRWSLLVVEGVLDFLAASIALVAPVGTVIALIYLAGAWAILTGAILFIAAFALRVIDGRWLMALGATVSIMWGALLLAWPIKGAVMMTWWLGGYAIVFGAALLGLAFQLWIAGRPPRVEITAPRTRPF